MNPSTELKSELEAFREQWLSEVQSKKPAGSSSAAQDAGPSTAPISNWAARRQSHSKPPVFGKQPLIHADDDHVQPPVFDEVLSSVASKGKGVGTSYGEEGEEKELVSALDHFEAAVMREAQGKLGDSLNLYRKAFRLDSGVDQTYRKKHFPPSAPPKHTPRTQAAPTSLPSSSTAPTAAQPPAPSPQPQSFTDLISSFRTLAITPLPPPVENAPQPPCPIAELPDEILVQILRDVAISDVADFARLSRVCKRLAFLVATEDRIWRRVCLGAEFGFGGMHHRFQVPLPGASITLDDPASTAASSPAEEEEDGFSTEYLTPEERAERDWQQKASTTLSLYQTAYPSWRAMFRSRPRLRFGGCYISTVNYIRAGQVSANHVTWNSPVHIVTYYRYLRLFRDGSAVSLLTTLEPADVVPHLTKDLLRLKDSGGSVNAAHVPPAVLSAALRARWKLVPADSPDTTTAASAQAQDKAPEGDLVVESEGATPKYIHRLDLSLRSAGRAAARSNKLVWKTHHSYNRLTDDWAVFQLKNEKPYFFSRVRSYGLGE